MNPASLIKVFAWIAIIALTCVVFIDDWQPLLILAAAITLVYKAFT